MVGSPLRAQTAPPRLVKRTLPTSDPVAASQPAVAPSRSAVQAGVPGGTAAGRAGAGGRGGAEIDGTILPGLVGAWVVGAAKDDGGLLPAGAQVKVVVEYVDDRRDLERLARG